MCCLFFPLKSWALCGFLLYLGLTQKAALPLFEGFAKQNLPRMLIKAL
jgi:hypothetical protein